MNELNFEALYFPIHNKKGKVVDSFPEVLKHPELIYEGIYNSDKILRYVIYLYSEQTPLVKKFRDNLLNRKKEALFLAGIKETAASLNEICDLKDEGVVRVVVKFLQIQKSSLWSNIVINEQAFAENVNVIMTAITDLDDKKTGETAKIKASLLTINDDISARLKGYFKEFFNDEILEAAYKKIDFRPSTPEDIAKIERAH